MTMSKPNNLPKAPPPNIITLRGRDSTYEFWGDTNIQSMTIFNCNLWRLDAQVSDSSKIHEALQDLKTKTKTKKTNNYPWAICFLIKSVQRHLRCQVCAGL